MAKKEYGTRKKYHFIYKTTNLLSGRYYIGMHSTDDLNDGYLGSGTLLRRSINKYGKENHSIEILEFVNSREQLAAREKEIVSLQEIAKKECMNLKVGGEGGFLESYRMDNAERKRRFLDKIHNDSEYREGFLDKCRKNYPKNLGKYKALGTHDYATFKGKNHSEETKKKIGAANSLKQKGQGNSQYGTCWITNEIENKKIRKSDRIPQGWRLGRKLK